MNIRYLKNPLLYLAAFLAAATGLLALLPTPTASAQQSGQAFSISPPLIELKADPGKTVNARIKLTNVSGGELLIKNQLNDFGSKNETGEPNIIFDESAAPSYSLRQWIKGPAPFKIKSKEAKSIDFPITVPKDAEPGGHYAVIRFTGTEPGLEESGVALSASIGSLVLLQVSGDVRQNASVEEFYASNDKFERSSFFEYGPVNFVERIRNTGNVHVKPTGTLDLYNVFGQKVDSIKVNGDANDPKNPPKSALPNSIRRFDQQLGKDKWLFGRYEAKLNLTYGDSKTPLLATTTFWVVPYKLLAVMILLAVLLFFGIRFGIKKYNAHIINKAQNNKP